MQENVAWKELLFVTRRERRDGAWGRGAPDAILLILLLVMLCCGALMSYSASAVYGEQFYGDSTYFLRRYVIFAVLAI